MIKHSTSLDTPATPVCPPLLSADASAAYLQHNPRTLANWRGLGKGPRYIRVGRRPFYRRSDLDAWLDAHVFEHTAAERAEAGR